MLKRKTDVCLILEGTYPYVAGGVSQWTHDLIRDLSHLNFHIVSIQPPHAELNPAFELPANVVGITDLRLQELPAGAMVEIDDPRFFQKLESALRSLLGGAGLNDLRQIIDILAPYHARIGAEALLNSKGAWEMLVRMYEDSMPDCSMLDYFWSWRSLLGGFYSILLADIPQADVYHTLCTGYAGVYAARAHLETGRPALLTEHGIYTNERRIELALADWLYEQEETSFSIDKRGRDIRDLWMDTFASYSRICYEASDRIITLYEGNFQLQTDDGADANKLAIIPNGIDYEKYAAIARVTDKKHPTIALIGRVTPIKDIKTFIHACAILKRKLPDIQAYVIGSAEEDPRYYEECRALLRRLSLTQTVTFTGQVDVSRYLPEIDVLVLTSLSEVQPLVILEAAAAGIPAVATDAGACRELLEGRRDESEAFGPGGEITALSSPATTAAAVERLLGDRDWYARCSAAARKRTQRYYNKKDQRKAYAELYAQYTRRQHVHAA